MGRWFLRDCQGQERLSGGLKRRYINWKNLYIWIGGDYFSKKAKLTFTGEETTLKIIQIRGRLKYIFELGVFNVY